MNRLRKEHDRVVSGGVDAVLEFMATAVPLLVDLAEAVLEREAANHEIDLCYAHRRVGSDLVAALRHRDFAEVACGQARLALEAYQDRLTDREVDM